MYLFEAGRLFEGKRPDLIKYVSGASEDEPAGGAGSEQQHEVVAEKNQRTEVTPTTEVKSQVRQLLLWALGSRYPYTEHTHRQR